MKTMIYLIRHGATDANLEHPPKLQGRDMDGPLARIGIRQAESTRDLLAVRPIDFFYSSPMLRARQTATIVASPHGKEPVALESLIECDVGGWEGLDWQTVRQRDEERYLAFMADPAQTGYPGGETFAQVHERVKAGMEELFARHPGKTLLVVGHHVVNRTYLAGLLGLGPGQARQVILDNCGISVIVRDGDRTTVNTLNATFHLQGVAA